MRVMRARRLVFLGALIVLSLEVVLVACNDDLPPGAGSSSGGNGDGGGRDAARSETSTPATDDDGGNDGSAVDAAEDTGVDTGPPFACYGDASRSDDAGVLPTACASSPSCSTYCDHIRDHYKLGVAQMAIACIAKLGSCANQTDVVLCVDNATAGACDDTAAKAYCTPLVTACDPNAGQPGSSIDQPSCEYVGRSLSPAGREAFAACLDEKTDAGTCPGQVNTCFDAIRL